jgi:5-methylcytosine-specific restriction endonuclease McrA
VIRGSGVVDHRVPAAAGGATDLANLWHLCEPCDERKTKADLVRLR